jgi:hypothetical protein
MSRPPLIFTLFILLTSSSLAKAQLFGFVKDSSSKETISGATVSLILSKKQVQTNDYGFFSLSMSTEYDTIVVRYSGYNTFKTCVKNFYNQSRFDISLLPNSIHLQEITVRDISLFQAKSPGKIKLSGNQIRNMPLLLGEKDPLKAFQSLPGIQEVSEGSAAYTVRGGGKDQNLILLDEAVVYNANHLFGFFSTFNADPIQHAEIYKSTFPAQYGGRLSSVLDVKMREGNKEKYKLEGGIGVISSRLLVEGPISRGKSSFLVAARRTYADLLLVPLQSEREKTGYNFMDVNAKINFELSKNSRLFFSLYSGSDIFYQKNKIPRREHFLINNTKLNWKNTTLTTRWNKVLGPKYFLNISLLYSKYYMNYQESTEQDYYSPPRFNRINLYSDIQDFSVKIDNDYSLSPNLQIRWGLKHTHYRFIPRNFYYHSNRIGEENLEFNAAHEKVNENAGFLNLTGQSKSWYYDLGLRLALYKGKSYLEPRIMVGKRLSSRFQVSTSYSRMNQFIQLVSNTGNGLPTDIWIPSTGKINPSSAHLLNLNLSYNLPSNWNITFDTYYKWLFGNNDYKSGVSFLGITNLGKQKTFLWEDIITQGKSWNYGYELAIEKQYKRIEVFAGYTLAWSIGKFKDLNQGKPFYTRQDRRHTFEISTKFKINTKFSANATFALLTGYPISFPNAVYFRKDPSYNYLEVYSAYNNFRTENYHRADIGIIWSRKKSSWDLSVYNVYNRKNPYSYRLENKFDIGNRTFIPTLSRQWLLPILPSITYNFKL